MDRPPRRQLGRAQDAEFGERHGWAGTRDLVAYLSVPKAIEVHATFDLDRLLRASIGPYTDDTVDRLVDTIGAPL